MNTVFFPSCPVSLETFEYSQDTPTKYTEALSFQCLSILESLATQGGKIFIETSTPQEQSEAFLSWQESFKTWLNSVEESVSAWLTESEESRLLPVLPLAPALPAAIGGAAVILYRGALVKAAVDGVSALIRTTQTAMANRRQTQLVRLIDKALLDNTWFGLGSTSKVDKLNVNLAQINDSLGRISSRLTVDDKNYSYQGIGQAIYDALTKWDSPDEEGNINGFKTITDILSGLKENPNIIKLLSHIILTHGGDIEEHEFFLSGENT